MKITIEATPKEIATLVLEVQEQPNVEKFDADKTINYIYETMKNKVRCSQNT